MRSVLSRLFLLLVALMIAASILVFIFSLRNKINRPMGAVMILLYIAAMVFAVVR